MPHPGQPVGMRAFPRVPELASGMRIRTLPLVLIASTAVVLTSCTGPDEVGPVPLPVPESVETSPAGEGDEAAGPTAETALVAAYLDAVAAGDADTAWGMLTPEAQGSAGSRESYVASSGRAGTVSPEDAERLRAVEPISAEGPEGAFTLVSASDGDVADAWIVRDTDRGLLLDDHVVPATGATPYEWRNPAAGPEGSADPVPAVDASRPLSVAFAAPEGGSEDGGLVGYPRRRGRGSTGPRCPSGSSPRDPAASSSSTPRPGRTTTRPVTRSRSCGRWEATRSPGAARPSRPDGRPARWARGGRASLANGSP
ncbi:hypothetical protein BC477_04855 [Clavibacter michiganensis subsp. michiganensis]|uniref:Uncharacterized protein n=1 Tax=Clavibacter michiganensis subsp. michiganensis TaxID=33013 RepID=A0A251XKP2_CLAMM|nr:hypothetical protein BC477_04855 [Clavibacter michiganensis subsp. michiganensis]OUE04044.1 hypothetical protein CMMCAS07_03785 [Clavibacter michiganensis subsp. michiganensis]